MMVGTETELRPQRFGGALSSRATDRWMALLAGAAVVATALAYFLPIFQVGGFVYTMIDSFGGGRRQFVTSIVLPILLGTVALAARRWWPRLVRAVVLAAVVMVTLTPVRHVAEALWEHEHPERHGAPFEFGSGFVVGSVAIVLGAIVFIVLVGELLAEPPSERFDQRIDVGAVVAAIGLLVAITGQFAESSNERLWQMPRWEQTGHWWELAVTTAVCGLAIWRRTPAALAAGVVVSLVAAASEGQRLVVISTVESDPSVSSTVRLVGYTIMACALGAALARSLHSDSVVRRA